MADTGEHITPVEDGVPEDSGAPDTMYRDAAHQLLTGRPSEGELQGGVFGVDSATLQMINNLLQGPQTKTDLLESPSIEFCRICRETSSIENFLSPCHCKGTLSNVHLTCLQRWLAESDTSYCELCGYQYKTVRIPKYKMMRALSLWCSEHCSRDLGFDALALCAFTPVAVLGTYLGMVASDSLDTYEDSGPVYARTLTLGVVSLMAAVDFAYVGWLLIRIQHHFHHWYSWWRRNCVVNIVFPEVKQDDTTTKTIISTK